MPTYEYACSSCGTHVEVYQRFSDEPLSECGVCGGPLRKVFHPAGILFKGAGFYKTDSRSARPSAKSKAASGSGTEAEAASTGKGKDSTAKSETAAGSGAGGKEQSA